MKVLLLNRLYSDNIGDQAIGLAMTSLLEKKGFTVTSVDLVDTNRVAPKKIDINQELKKIKTKKIRHIFTKSAKYQALTWSRINISTVKRISNESWDYIFIGGGELIQSNFIFAHALYKWIKRIKMMNKIEQNKIIFFSVGATKSYSRIDKKKINYVLQNVGSVFVRDYKSSEYLLNIFEVKSKNTPDCVFSCDAINTLDSERSFILFGLRSYQSLKKHSVSYMSLQEYYTAMFEKYLSSYSQNANDIHLIYANNDDFKTVIEFKSFIQDKYGLCLQIAKYDSFIGFLEMMKKTRVLISPRMHACIVAMVNNVSEIYPVLISSKLKTFNEIYFKSKTNIDILSNQVSKALHEALEI